jgi:hypothetical protein
MLDKMKRHVVTNWGIAAVKRIQYTPLHQFNTKAASPLVNLTADP